MLFMFLKTHLNKKTNRNVNQPHNPYNIILLLMLVFYLNEHL